MEIKNMKMKIAVIYREWLALTRPGPHDVGRAGPSGTLVDSPLPAFFTGG
jgi:hypothetical protein